MPSLDTLMTFGVAAFLLCISPGPSNLYIMARSISQGPKAGITAASGMALGSFIYVLASAFGLAAIFIYSPWTYTAVKFIGAAYLLYLAFHYFSLAKPAVEPGHKLPVMQARFIFRQSVVVELTNPKTALFFIAFLPLFVDHKQPDVSSQLIVLGMIYAVIGLMCDLLVATLSGKIGLWLNHHPQFSVWQNRASASLLFIIAAYILFEECLVLLQAG